MALTPLPFKLIDLTHALGPNIPSWHGDCGFLHTIDQDYDRISPYQFRTHTIEMKEGMGTHIDAPAHCAEGGRSISEIDVNELASPCIVIDVSKKLHEDYVVPLEDIHQFESEYGIIVQNSLVIVRTGWDKFWSQPEKYRNQLRFPSVSREVAAFLLNERNINGLGIDTLSPDNPKNGYPVHKMLLNADKYIIENIANSASLPPTGSYSLALPMKISQGTEAPIRLVGLIL